MSPFFLKRKTFKRTLLVTLVLIVVTVGTLAFLLFRPSAPIVISKETTYLTEPLDKFGYVDYFEAIRGEQKEGVTVENNAAVLLWQAYGRRDLPPDEVGPHFEELGIPVPPEDGDYLPTIHGDELVAEGVAWLESLRTAASSGEVSDGPEDQGIVPRGVADDIELRDLFEELTHRAIGHPWRSEDLPPLAERLKQNQKPIALIFEATKRPRMYAPMVRPAPDTEFGVTLLALRMPTTQVCQNATRALALRSMWHLGEGRREAAWEDAMACHRLSRLVGQGPTLVDHVLATVIDLIAHQLDVAILEQPLSAEQCERIRHDLAGLPRCCDIGRCLNRSERFTCLDAITAMARGARVGDLADNGVGRMSVRVSIDWNVPLRMGNECFDELVAAASIPRFADREAALERAEAQILELLDTGSMPKRIAKSLVSRQARSEAIGSVFAGMLLPAIGAATVAEDRSNTYFALTQVAVELAAYRASNGDYPAELEDLDEDVFAELPLDLFTEKPFLYERRGEAYLLYSVGPDQQDDGGSSLRMNVLEGVPIDDEDNATRDEIDPEADDFAIRLPLPPFSWSERITKAVQGDSDEESEEVGSAGTDAARSGESDRSP